MLHQLYQHKYIESIIIYKYIYVRVNTLWKDRGIPTALKVRTLNILVWPVALYSCETGRSRKRKKTESYQQRCGLTVDIQLLRISWKDKRTNSSILEELQTSKLWYY